MSDLASRIAPVLEEHRHKSPRVQARLVAEALTAKAKPVTTLPEADRPEPAAWVEFQERLNSDPLRRLVDDGYATTRNRTHAAMRALGLEPNDIRALVVEHDFIRVYRWTDRAAAQTVPILEEPA